MKKLTIMVGLAMLLALAVPYGAEAQPVSEVKKLTASDAQNGDLFGIRVAISGDTAVVGADHEDGAGSSRGAAYVFQRDQDGAGNWGEVTKLTASDAQDVDLFGRSAAVSGDTAVVGASGDDGAGSGAGAAYVFGRDQGGAGNWGEVKKLTASDAEDGDGFGVSVAVSGDTAVVGAHHEDGGGSWRGAAYVFERDQGGAGNWGEVKKLTASDAEDSDLFGFSVAISGDNAVVGALGAGAAYVFGPSLAVGGIAELPPLAESSTEASSPADGAGRPAGAYAGLAGLGALALLAIAAGGWQVRRRRVR